MFFDQFMKQSKLIAASGVCCNACFNTASSGGVSARPPTLSNWFSLGRWCVCINHSLRWRNGGGAVPDSLSPFLAFSGMFCESQRVCVGFILPITQRTEALWGID